MSPIEQLLTNNRDWAAEMIATDSTFFQKLSEQQTPAYLWIGCSDSRVPSTQLVGLLPGEMFVHRNVANVVVHTDLNCLSVLHFAVDALQIKDIIVCGHYGCGGVKAAFKNYKFGLIDNWLRHVQDVHHKHAGLLSRYADEEDQLDRLCELNVIEQVVNVSQTTIVQQAWERGQSLAVHGLIYGLVNGLLQDLQICVTGPDTLDEQYERAIAKIKHRVS